MESTDLIWILPLAIFLVCVIITIIPSGIISDIYEHIKKKLIARIETKNKIKKSIKKVSSRLDRFKFNSCIIIILAVILTVSSLLSTFTYGGYASQIAKDKNCSLTDYNFTLPENASKLTYLLPNKLTLEGAYICNGNQKEITIGQNNAKEEVNPDIIFLDKTGKYYNLTDGEEIHQNESASILPTDTE